MPGVLEEHHDYLILQHRHALFAQAIAKIVQPGDSVADLGCGFGVLGIQCLQAGAAHVSGIDRTDAIEIARETVRREGLGDSYTCIRASSFRAELPEPVDVVICDHVGFFGIDYGIIAMLEDARRRMLKHGGKVIPRQIALQVAGVSSDACRALATAWSQAPIPPEYAWLDSYAVNTKHAVDLTREDLCSQSMALGRVRLDEDNAEALEFAAQIAITRDCRLDGLAGWFHCELADDIWMNNSPLAEDSIGRSQAFFPLVTPVEVCAGDIISLSFKIFHEHPFISWNADFPGDQPRQSMTTWKSTILTQADLAAQTGAALSPNPLGRARAALHTLLDGTRSAQQIESALRAMEPPLFPSDDELRRFVKAELSVTSA